MPFANGVFSRLYSWVADKAAGIDMLPDRMDADADDIAFALSNAVLRDGTGRPTADISFAGHAATNLKAPVNAGDALSLGSTPSSEVSTALGFQPVSSGPPVASGGHQVAITYDGTGLAASVDGNGAFGRVWTGNTLTAAALGGILGYTPGRVTTPFAASSSGAGDLPSGASEVVTGITFTATGTSAFIAGNAAVYNNSGGGAIQVQASIDLFDNTAGAEVGSGVPGLCNVTYGQGESCLSCHLVTGGLTPGHVYTARLNMAKGSTAGVTPFQSCAIGGFCS